MPMEQRPLDEVDAVQALMSVGRGSRAQTEAMPALDQASDCGPGAIDNHSDAVDMSEVRFFVSLIAHGDREREGCVVGGFRDARCT